MFFYLFVFFATCDFAEAGAFSHPCENDLVVWSTSGKIPFFNAQIYFENIEPIGKVDEIFGGPQENVRFLFWSMIDRHISF